MNISHSASCTQRTITLDDSVQKVCVFTNLKTTLQICVFPNHIISGLDREKETYGCQHKLQDGKLQLTASDNKRVRKHGAKENMKVRDSAHSAMKGTGKKKRKATRIQSSSDEADDR